MRVELGRVLRIQLLKPGLRLELQRNVECMLSETLDSSNYTGGVGGSEELRKIEALAISITKKRETETYSVTEK